MTNMEKALELLKNEDFAKKVAACGDQNAALELFKNNGAAITSTELENIGKSLQAAQDNDGELPDELAEKVAGGGFGDILKTIGEVITALGPLVDKIMALFQPSTAQTASSSNTAPASSSGTDNTASGSSTPIGGAQS